MSETGFLLAEDEAVKLNLSGLTVTDDRNNARAVEVFFRWPNEEAEKFYPFITIDLVGIAHANDRQHSDQWIYGVHGTPTVGQATFLANNPAGTFDYWPDTTADLTTMGTSGYNRTVEFIPVNLTYQIATHCRNPRHDRQLMAKLFATGKIPYRYGYIEVPADGSIRRMDLLGWASADLYDQEAAQRKMIFRKVFTVMTTAELAPFQLSALNTVSTVTRTTKLL